MSAPANHYKLGLFVIAGLVTALASLVLFGRARLAEDVVRYHSYFNESVQGLELGAPVKFRGVTVGRVAAIEIAPDHRMVDVISELSAKEVARMGFAVSNPESGSSEYRVPPDLRTQLNSQGITGLKFVAIDFFDIKSNPPPPITFAIPTERYIPAASSMMKNLEDTVSKAMDRLPEMTDAVVAIMGKIDGLVATLSSRDVSGRVVSLLEQTNTVMQRLERIATRLDEHDIGGKAATTLTDLHATITKTNAILDTLGAQEGLLASARRATDSFRELGRAGHAAERNLESTLRDISEAAEAIRLLAESLDRDPDMLLKGRAKGEVAR